MPLPGLSTTISPGAGAQAATIAAPGSPRTRMRPIGPTSPMRSDGSPRGALGGRAVGEVGRVALAGVQDRSSPWRGRVAISAATVGTIATTGVRSLPSVSPKPPGSRKSRCMSMTTSAVRAGSKRKAKGSAATSIIAQCPAMWRPIVVAVGARGVGEIGDLAARHDGDAVGEFEDFVEVLGDEQHRRAAVALLHDLGADVGDGGEVEAEAGIGDDQHVDVAGEFAREHRALHVAAGEVADRRLGRGRLDVVARDQFARLGAASARATARSRAGPSAACRSCGRPCSRPPTWSATEAFFSGSSGRPNTLKRSKWSRFGSKFWSRISTWPSLIGRWPESASTSSLWPLPETPGDADDLAGLDLDVEAGDRVAALVVLGEQARDLERHAVLRRLRSRAAEGRTTASPIIIAAISRVETAPTLPPPTLRAAPEHGEVVAERLDLAELVADHRDRDLAAMRHLAQEPEDLVRLARRQHRGRLVEDEEALVEIEELQDFELLLLARREARDRPVERDAKRHPLEEGFERPALLAPVDEGRRVGAADDEVLGRGQRRHQGEVLVDHADAERLRVARIAHRDLRRRRSRAGPCRACRSP